MKRIDAFVLLFSCICSFLAYAAETVTAQESCQYYYGYAHLNGANAPIGTHVEVYSGNNEFLADWNTSEEAANYSLTIIVTNESTLSDHKATTGENLIFKLNDLVAHVPAPGTEIITAVYGGIPVIRGEVDINASGANCSNCTNCITAITSAPSVATIYLTADIHNHSGTCIDNPVNFSNKTFDCQGHTIDGDDSGTDYGIYVNGNGRDTINNCILTDFYHGIFLYNSSNNTLTNIIANESDHGILLYEFSHFNTLTNITANENSYGVSLCSSSNNTLINITTNSNTELGLSLNPSSSNTLIDIIANSNGNGVSLYSSSSNTLSHITVSSNSYYGIYLRSSSNNTLTNIIANESDHGVTLDSYSNNNTLTNIIANSNAIYGFELDDYAANNTFINNTATNNQRHGFYVSLITNVNNILNSNRFCDNNQSGGAYYDIYNNASNSGDNNTCDLVNNWNDQETWGCTYACDGKTRVRDTLSLFYGWNLLSVPIALP